MGAILCLRKMPGNCRECFMARKGERDRMVCGIRGTEIIAYSHRNCRMPLCPLRNEGEYLGCRIKPVRKMVLKSRKQEAWRTTINITIGADRR